MTVTLESLKKSVGKKSSNSEVFAWLADLERAAGDLDGALQRVDGGLTLYPNDLAAMIVRAKILFQQEKFEECVHQCEIILVKDPFSLAGQKIMGDAYDKLGNVAERNLCYRRYHDMDPLNGFWKDEYDVVETAVATAVAADLTMPDIEFSMPEDDGSSLFEKSSESQAENANAEASLELPAEEDGGLFEKSSSSVGISLDEEQSNNTASPFSKNLFEEIAEEQAPAMEMSSGEDDPFAALAAMLPNSDAADDSMMEDLSASLDATMADISANSSKDKPVEEFPVDDNISGIDVNSAMSDFFGLEDDLEAEETSGAGSKAVLDESPVDESASTNASMVFSSAAAEDKPMSVDNAFDSIFGEDELPEEKPQAEAAAEASLELPAEESLELPAEESLDLPAEEPAAKLEDSVSLDGEWSPTPKTEDNALSVEGAFSSIFGDDDDLPEEKSEGATASEEPAVAEDKPMSVDNAFDSIFGEDELPEEKPQAEAAAEASLELPAEESPELPAEESLDIPAEEPSMVSEVETPTDPVISSAMDFILDDEPAASEESAPAEDVAPAAESGFSVDSAFDSLFGNDDDLPEEKSEGATASEEPAENTSTLAERVDLAEAELEMPSVQKDESSDLVKEMGGAFASMFGDQDDLDLPELDGSNKNNVTKSAADDQQATGAAFEEASAEKLESDLDKSFSSLFGDDDDLSLPEESAQETPAMQNLDSLESEVSGAFKGLFEMDDDSLNLDQDKPSNSGVDFLMSGDSDDEVSAGLINNPDAPLNRGAQELDESLNTKTLAEIYFDQGLYGKALEIYKDLAMKEPENQEIANRMAEVEKLYRQKFGGNG